jgi:hypothetical protein
MRGPGGRAPRTGWPPGPGPVPVGWAAAVRCVARRRSRSAGFGIRRTYVRTSAVPERPSITVLPSFRYGSHNAESDVDVATSPPGDFVDAAQTDRGIKDRGWLAGLASALLQTVSGTEIRGAKRLH